MATSFEKDYSDTDWWLFTRSGGSQTKTDSGVAVGIGWVRLRIRRVDASTIGFSLDGGNESQQTTNIPTIALQAFVSIPNNENQTKSVDVDYFTISITGLSR